MSAVDMVSGILRALAGRGYKSIDVRENIFLLACERAYHLLSECEESYDLDVRFSVVTDGWGDSGVLQSALDTVVATGLVSYAGVHYQELELGCIEGLVMLEKLPGGPALYEELANRVLETYQSASVPAGLIDLGDQ
jgi:hypothetical protein